MSDAVRDRILRRKKIEEAMEAAFDDDLYVVEKAIEDPKLPIPVNPECGRRTSAGGPGGPPKEDSLLGQAACGGALQVIPYLLGKGANPDHIGEHNRCPLMRACYNEQVEAVLALLEGGADPRLLLPQEKVADEITGELTTVFRDWDIEELNGVNCCQEIKDILRKWPITRTFELQKARAGNMSQKSSEDRKEAENKQKLFKDEVDELEQKMALAEQQHREAIAIRENRIREYDMSKCGGGIGNCNTAPTAENKKVLDQLESLINEAEETEMKVCRKKEEIRATLRKKRVGLRQQEALLGGGLRYNIDTSMYQMEDILSEGEQQTNAKGGEKSNTSRGGDVEPTNVIVTRPTLMVDETGSGNCAKFLTYRPVLMLDLGHSQHMNNVELRGALLSAIRYGRVLVLFIRDWDIVEALAEFSDQLDKIDALLVDAGKPTTRDGGDREEEDGTPFASKGALFKALCTGELSRTDKSTTLNKLITTSLELERPEFLKKSFKASEKARFRFNILTEMPFPQQVVLDQYFSVRITGPIPK